MSILLDRSLMIAHIVLAIAAALASYRVVAGPRAQDRVLGLDTLYTNVILLILTFGIRYGTGLYFEAALVISLTSFVATAALSKFLLRGEVIE